LRAWESKLAQCFRVILAFFLARNLNPRVAGNQQHFPDEAPIFSATMYFKVLRNVTFMFFNIAFLINADDSRPSMAVQQHWIAEALHS
jgi:hypothetical protein